jgi:hypothetical protein
MLQTMNFGRTTLIKFFGVESKAWALRSIRGEVALGFGLAKPAFTNQYGEIDLFSIALSVLIARLVKITMGQAAQLVRDNWRPTMEGLARAERMKPSAPASSGVCFVIGSDPDKTKIKVEVGRCESAIDAIGADMVPHAIPLDLVLSRVRAAAEEVGLSLPEPLTPGPPESREFKKWIAAAEDLRRFAKMKGTTREPLTVE